MPANIPSFFNLCQVPNTHLSQSRRVGRGSIAKKVENTHVSKKLPTDGPINQWTDTARCRVACPRLKRRKKFRPITVNIPQLIQLYNSDTKKSYLPKFSSQILLKSIILFSFLHRRHLLRGCRCYVCRRFHRIRRRCHNL